MRPLRLELQGFTSFRDRTEVDFTDADLFALAGDMGAGKSSIIDAMGFALYGAVARFHNLSLVAPVISQGLNEARVRLVFRIGDIEYAATRIVRRTPAGGARAPEARLTRGDEVLADTADEVTREIEQRLGLTFEQFNRCVVLPQGEFAQLLHARPAERQELLVRLLDIGLYQRVGTAARGRASLSRGLADSLKQRLENDLADATEEAYREQEKRVSQLGDLLARLEQEEEALQALRKDAAEHANACRAAEQAIATLTGIKAPAGVKDFGERLRGAQQAVDLARAEAREAAIALAACQVQRAALPERALVETYIAGHYRRETLLRLLSEDEGRLEAAAAKVATATEAGKGAEANAVAAEDRKSSLERAHSAFHASRGLKAGDNCPVCGEKLTGAPTISEPAGLSRAENELKLAQNELRKRRQEEQSARLEHGRLEVQVAGERRDLADVKKLLREVPDAEECLALLKDIDVIDQALSEARKRDEEARDVVEGLTQELARFEDDERKGWQVFNVARDSVAVYGAPAAGDSVAASWDALCAWSQTAAEEHETARDGARRREEAVLAKVRDIEQAQVAACADAGVTPAPRGLLAAVIQTKTRAEEKLRLIDQRLADRISIERDLQEKIEESRIAALLGLHLNSTHFERWYLEEAMTRLVEGASTRLLDLSSGQYSMGLNKTKTDFVVIDHINLNEERPVRTLSGGETFLASLALALALGDDIANLAANGAARLDALFLDEGFGALDQNTLETVATAIEELGARGRMVGIVTHVKELADRLPVQYEVRKEGRSSRVVRVDAR